MSKGEVAKHIIGPDDFVIQRVLGSGSFGDVYLAQSNKNFELMAVKLIKKVSENKYDNIAFMREVEILASVKYPSILPFIGFSLPDVRNPHPMIATKFMENGSLDLLINYEYSGQHPRGWNNTKKMIVIIGIVAAMRYLHKNGIVHRDLKPANVLLNMNFEPFVCDFGLSKFMDTSGDEKMQTVNCGTPVFMAPEIFADQNYTNQVDVYSFAMVLYSLFTGLNPFHEIKNYLTIPVMVCRGDRPHLPDTVPPSYQQLIRQCWAGNPQERPTFDSLFKAFSEGIFDLPDTDRREIKAYIGKLNASETRSIADLNNEIATLRAENEKLRKQLEQSQTQFQGPTQAAVQSTAMAEGIAAQLWPLQKSIFDRYFIYSRSSFDINLCLGREGSFGIASAPNLFLQLEFPREYKFTRLKLRAFDHSFRSFWRLVVVSERGYEQLAYERRLPPADLEDDTSVDVSFGALKGNVVRLEKTGEPFSVSFVSVELFDGKGRAVLRGLSKPPGDSFHASMNATVSNYFATMLHSARSEIVVFTRDGGSEFVQLEFTRGSVLLSGYRVKRDAALTMRGWELRVSGDGKTFETVDAVSESSRGELGRVVERRVAGKGPLRFFRICPTAKPWPGAGCFNTHMCHFDVFGQYTEGL